MTEPSSEDVAVGRDIMPMTHEGCSAMIRQRLLVYLGQLGLREPSLVATLADECVQRAKRRTAPGAEDELMRRALEEAQRRFDHAVARVADLVAGKDFHTIAAARAAFLWGCAGDLSSDDLFRPHVDIKEFAGRLRPVLPQPVPPESNLQMPDQHITFLFSRSKRARK